MMVYVHVPLQSCRLNTIRVGYENNTIYTSHTIRMTQALGKSVCLGYALGKSIPANFQWPRVHLHNLVISKKPFAKALLSIVLY